MGAIDQDRWRAAYLNEIARVASETSDRILDTVFFGGGTPSLMNPDLVADILEKIRGGWRISNSFEVTLEANPTSVESGRFQGYRDGGVNRVSMGIQALNDPDLKALGRLHTSKEAYRAFDVARGVFDRVSFDLIYARQNQTLADWQDELAKALDMAVDHVSLYQLTIEPGTAFGDRHSRGGLLGLPPENLAADMYFATQEICEAAGLPAYETSNHARPGAESRHNQVYWKYGDYLGIGPGAHGRLTLNSQRYATETEKAPSVWLGQVEGNGSGESRRDILSPHDMGTEYVLMGMRLVSGISADRFERLANQPINYNKINYLKDIGMLEVDGSNIRATPMGRPVLNALISTILEGVT